MATMDDIMRALGGFGAGIQGRGQEYLQQLDQQRQMAMIQDAVQVESALKQGDAERARRLLVNRVENINRLGGDPSDTMGVLQKIDSGNVAGALNDVMTVTEYAYQSGMLQRPPREGADKPAGLREFEEMTKNLTPEEQEKAKRIALGLDPRAMGSAAQTIAATGSAQQVASSEAIIDAAKSGASEKARLEQQYKLSPKIAEAVEVAVGSAKAAAETRKEQKSNAKALEVYNAGISGLNQSLENAYTGPIAGMLPALAENDRIADGAVAMMAPVLKQMFRSAGEGVFTDKDQELLLGMIPDRRDKPDVRKAKLSMLDTLVRAKLGASIQPEQGKQASDEELINKYLR